MATILRVLSKTQSVNWCKVIVASPQISRNKSDSCTNEAPMLDAQLTLLKPDELEQKRKMAGTIAVQETVDLSSIMGLPEEHVKGRRARISIPHKNAMQSGTNNINFWRVDFDNRERWENPLMGWTSTGDPLSNMHIKFNSKEEAIAHCEKNGWKWFLDAEKAPKKSKVKNYGVNFSWNRRTRVSTK